MTTLSEEERALRWAEDLLLAILHGNPNVREGNVFQGERGFRRVPRRVRRLAGLVLRHYPGPVRVERIGQELQAFDLMCRLPGLSISRIEREGKGVWFQVRWQNGVKGVCVFGPTLPRAIMSAWESWVNEGEPIIEVVNRPVGEDDNAQGDD